MAAALAVSTTPIKYDKGWSTGQIVVLSLAAIFTVGLVGGTLYEVVRKPSAGPVGPAQVQAGDGVQDVPTTGSVVLSLPQGGTWAMDPANTTLGPIEGLPAGTSAPAAGSSGTITIPVSGPTQITYWWQESNGTGHGGTLNITVA